MRTIRMGTVRYAAAITALSLSSLQAQTVQASLAKEAAALSDKFSGLARVMTGKYDWKPGEGVRSVSDVFNLIVAENGVLARTLTGVAAGGRPAPITDPEKLQEALKTSYANVQRAIEGLSDTDLNAPVKNIRRGHDQRRSHSVPLRGSARASWAVDRLCTHERRCPAMVEIACSSRPRYFAGRSSRVMEIALTPAKKSWTPRRVDL
jgi:hypothetical protein